MRPETDGPLRLPAGTVARPEVLEEVHELLARAWTRHPDVAPADRMGVETAVIELAANIVEHAACGNRVDLALEVDVSADQVRALFVDSGAPFDGDASAAVLPDDVLAERGRGLAMAHAVVDELAYERTGTSNRWRVVRRRR